MNLRRVVIIALLVAVFLAAACVSQAPVGSPQLQSPSMTPVSIAYLPVVSNAPIFIALDEGYFARQGIAVELVKFQSSTTAFPSLINGDIAVSGGAVSPSLANAVTTGTHVRIVADKGRNSPGGACNASGIMVRRDLVENGTIRTVSDLKGRKVMVNGDQAYRISRILKMGNLTSDDVEITNMDFASGVVAFMNGAIDAGDMTEPYVTQLQDSKTAVMLFPTEYSTPDYPTPLFYGPAFLDKDPELGKKFMVAYLQGVRQYNEGKTDRNIAIIANYTHLDTDLLKRSCWLPIDPSGDLPRKPVRDYLDWTFENKKISRNPTDDQIFDMSYVRYANGVLANTSSGK